MAPAGIVSVTVLRHPTISISWCCAIIATIIFILVFPPLTICPPPLHNPLLFHLYFWRTRSILLPEQGFIYVGGVGTFWQLTSMFCHSLGSDLICKYIPFWRFLDTLFFNLFFLHTHILFLLHYVPNRSRSCKFFPSNLSLSSVLYLYFSCSTLSDFFCHSDIAFLFPPASHGPSGTSLHILILHCTGGRLALFKHCRLYFLGSPFWCYIGPFLTHFLIFVFINVANPPFCIFL